MPLEKSYRKRLCLHVYSSGHLTHLTLLSQCSNRSPQPRYGRCVTMSSFTGVPSLQRPMNRCCGVFPNAYSRFLP
jgi:hypothetical protein